MFKKTCYTAPTQPAPNPDTSRWELLDVFTFDNAFVLRVRYLDCTNFEGVKVMVYRGAFRQVFGTLKDIRHPWTRLDPHFAPGPQSPIARFRPDEDGLALALAVAKAMPA
jgi:hypothetical protein